MWPMADITIRNCLTTINGDVYYNQEQSKRIHHFSDVCYYETPNQSMILYTEACLECVHSCYNGGDTDIFISHQVLSILLSKLLHQPPPMYWLLYVYSNIHTNCNKDY